MTKLNDLIKQKEALEKAIAEQLVADKAPVIEAIKKQIKQFDITAKELGFKTSRAKPATEKKPSVAKYKHPDGSTWAGQGRAPKWITGKDGKADEKLKAQYLIK